MSQTDLFPREGAAQEPQPAPLKNALRSSLSELAVGLPADWLEIVQPFLASDAGRVLEATLKSSTDSGAIVYPADPFRALRLTPLDDVKLVILGQDPYHGPGQAEGLAFSVPHGVRVPPSLRNIFKEYARDLGCAIPSGGSLVSWAQRGVLLLNTVLTVEASRPASHQRIGWEALTVYLIQAVAAHPCPKVFLLWGAHAQASAALIPAPHLVLMANHPSPLSVNRPPTPFQGCGHFSRARAFLQQAGSAMPLIEN